MLIPRIGGVSLDCADPRRLGTFWAELLDGEIIHSSSDVVIVRVDHLLLTALRVEDYVPPTWPHGGAPKQLHLDLDIEDLEGAESRALSLGAVRAQVQPEPEGHLVLLDPAGHPFCLTTEVADWR
ncbi:MAG TPA: VOC family protein [Acidimicrobiales bacterium]|nr:VOC family protein [Acidimicrobiales bacterium]